MQAVIVNRGVDPLPKLGVFKCVRLPDTLEAKAQPQTLLSLPFASSPSFTVSLPSPPFSLPFRLSLLFSQVQ